MNVDNVSGPPGLGYYNALLTCDTLKFSFFRASFEELQSDYVVYWFFLDFLADLVYLADMFFRTRTGTEK